MNRKNVEKLRDFLRDEVPDERFDMRSYVRGGSKVAVRARLNECGTTACIGGWAAYLFTPRRRWAHEHAGQALGLDKDQAEELFEPDGLYDDARYSRARAIATLTRLLETGEVDWGDGMTADIARIPRAQPPRDPLAETRDMLANLRATQISSLEDALYRTVEAAAAVSAADILHDERTRQLADQIASVNRTLALDLDKLKRRA